DSTFGSKGLVSTDFFGDIDGVSGLVIQGDGKLVVAGSATPVANQLSEVALARYSANGTLDASFGSGGIRTSTLVWSGYDIALTGAGKLVVTGTHRSGPDVDRASVAQFSSTGSLDTTFGQSGLTVTGMENGSKLVLDAGGRIVVAGYMFNPAGAN